MNEKEDIPGLVDFMCSPDPDNWTIFFELVDKGVVWDCVEYLFDVKLPTMEVEIDEENHCYFCVGSFLFGMALTFSQNYNYSSKYFCETQKLYDSYELGKPEEEFYYLQIEVEMKAKPLDDHLFYDFVWEVYKHVLDAKIKYDEEKY